VKNQLKTGMKVIPLMVVYLFFHLTNSFFSPRRTADDNYTARLSPKAANAVHLSKAAKTTISENRLSFKRYIQKTSQFFILLLFFTVFIPIIYRLSAPEYRFLSDPSYLRFHVMRI
jgi:hypothetical protein